MLGKAKAQNKYQTLATLYEAETGANLSLWEGRQRNRSAGVRAFGTALSGGASVYQAWNRGR